MAATAAARMAPTTAPARAAAQGPGVGVRSSVSAGGGSPQRVASLPRSPGGLQEARRQAQQRYGQLFSRAGGSEANAGAQSQPQQQEEPSTECYIFNLCVDRRYRRQGIARKLLAEAEGIARRRKCEEAFLHVDFGNDAAEKLYSSIGYSFVEDEEGKWRYIAGARKRKLFRLVL